MRRTSILPALVAAGLIAGTVSACGSSADAGDSGSGTVTLGMLAPLNGTFAQSGKEMVNGAKIAISEINAAGGVDGKKLKLDIKDDGSDPQKTSQATRDLASAGDKLIFGAFTSTECLAVKSLVKATGGVYIAPTCVDPTVTGSGPGKPGTDNVFRTGLRSAPDEPVSQKQPSIMHELAPDAKTWDYFGYDYSFGHEQESTFAAHITKVSGDLKMGSTVFIPLTSQNFRPYVSKLASAVNSDSSGRGLLLGTYGAGLGSFLQQAAAFNFLDKYKMIWTAGDPWNVLMAANGRFPKLWNSYDYMWAAYDNPTNTQFVKDYKKAYGHMPGGNAAEQFNAVQAFAAAIKKAKSTDPNAVAAALAGLTFKATQGDMTIDATTHQADTNQVLSQLEGDPSSPDGVKILRTVIVDPKDASYKNGATSLNLG